MFARLKTARQVAALPFVATHAGIEVLLITSRRRGRWIIPKGWPTRGLTGPESAAHEAMEEAGVRGCISEAPVGSFRYAKRMQRGYEIDATVFVYPLLVLEHRLEWQEMRDRRIAWHRLANAARVVEERALARLIARLGRDGGAGLGALAARMSDAGQALAGEDA